MRKALPFNKNVLFFELHSFNALVVNVICLAGYTNQTR